MPSQTASDRNSSSTARPKGRLRRRPGRLSRGVYLALPLGGHHLPGLVEPPPGVVDHVLWVVGGVIVFAMAAYFVWGMIKRRR
ncbi:MAG: hypothetical protein KJ621_03850 [Proteobacteria bacterium]|nr:hypothetical protein [Pseudomonadota bacterium]MBU1742179.1 hypothetical protein [Pseudomonadota bacterium]